MERFMLKQFFHEMLVLSYNDLRTGWGNPCTWLLETMCIRQEPFLDKIMGDYTGNSHEVRLNNAGLKMHWRVHRNGDKSAFKCYISGDQILEYPMFVAQARSLIMKHGYHKQYHEINWRYVR